MAEKQQKQNTERNKKKSFQVTKEFLQEIQEIQPNQSRQKNQKLFQGLSVEEAIALQKKYGKNELVPKKKENLFYKIFHVLKEPMFLLLLMAAIIYFLLGEPKDGGIMLIFVIGVISIDVAQEWKTDKTLTALKNLSEPKIQVIRDGIEQWIDSVDLVPNDLMFIYEGIKIPADGLIMQCSDLCVDESSLTGEAQGVWNPNYCYAGTMVLHGLAMVKVEKIGRKTEYGKIGIHVAEAPLELTLLQKQMNALVKGCAIIAILLFFLVGIFTYFNLSDYEWTERFIKSILSGVTLAMAMIPEEFPVILTVFLSMGAWRLAKKKSLVRNLPSVETLGAISVLCVDKTGTITKNQMDVQEIWTAKDQKKSLLIETMGLACEPNAYDPMEKAIISFCGKVGFSKEELFWGELIKEYAFTNELKMMGHIWKRRNKIVLAAKGSFEHILRCCMLNEKEREIVDSEALKMSKKGLRVLAVARKEFSVEFQFPAMLDECSMTLLGLIGMADPPREGIAEDLGLCNQAGIQVIMITGDSGDTASAIAKKVNLDIHNGFLTGEMIDKLSDLQLRERVKEVNLFARVIPEHKMRIVKALKENGEMVAMIGDGVNDALALKYADIGISMGKRGSEVSREAADLILMDDNFTTIVETIRDGRRIYNNIQKAVGYIFVIHIPIALSALLAPFLRIPSTALFLLPLHIVLLELFIDPTCSILLERQPEEKNIMRREPRKTNKKLLTKSIFLKSVVQGLILFFVAFGTYYTVLNGNVAYASQARAMGLSVLILANLFLVFVNSSENLLVYQSIQQLYKDKVMWMGVIGTLLMLGIILYTPLNHVLKLCALSGKQLIEVLLLAVMSVFWYEIIKLIKQIRYIKRNKIMKNR